MYELLLTLCSIALLTCCLYRFLNAPLQEVLYNNISQWTAFAFFSKELEDMSVDEIRDNRDIIRIIEDDYLKFKFLPGYNRGITCAMH